MSAILRPRVGKTSLAQVCDKLGIPQPHWRDEWYELFKSRDQFKLEYRNHIFSRVSEFIPNGYQKGKSDCDKFGLVALVEVQYRYRIRRDCLDECAIAFGCTDIWADPKAEISHDLNILFAWGDSPKSEIENIVVAFFEPQNCTFASVAKERYQEATIYV